MRRRTTAALLLLGTCALAGVLLAGFVAPVAAGTAVLADRASAAVDATSGRLADGRVRAATVVTDVTGAPIAYLYDRYRRPVPASAISPAMTAAIVAVEDRRFFTHDGVDWRGLGRAVASNAATGSPLEGQGASTLTMQYVKNYRLYAVADSAAERRAATADTVGRKLTEVQLAHRVEERLSKPEILARYLDLVYYGRGAYGIEAAAQTFFGVDAGSLDVPQAALLAGVVRSPEGYDPVGNPDAARARRDTVLTAMVDVGSLTPVEGAAARAQPLGVRADPEPPAEGCAAARPGTGFFCRYVTDHLAGLGMDLAELRRGGYTIRTTLDPAVAAEAERATDEAVADGAEVADVAAVVAPGPIRRPVLALAANRTYGNDADAGESAYPLPTAPLRGAGSVYKIFTAATALERGLVTPSSDLDVPERYTSTTTPDGYTVENLGSFPDRLSLTRALARSPNTAFVSLVDRIGSVAPVVDMARRLGMRTTLDAPAPGGGTVGSRVADERRASFTLGPEATSPLDLASVMATIASGGTWCPPTPIAAIRDGDGRVVPLAEPGCERAVDESVARDLATALSEGAVDGTSDDAADSVGWDRPVLAKTGTTQVSASAAFVGATDRYAASVMTFSDRGAPSPVCLDPVEVCSGGEDGELTGGSVPADTWFSMMDPLSTGPDRPVLAGVGDGGADGSGRSSDESSDGGSSDGGGSSGDDSDGDSDDGDSDDGD